MASPTPIPPTTPPTPPTPPDLSKINDFLISLIRTAAASLVGWLVTWLIAHGVKIDSATTMLGITFLGWALTSGYYAVVRLLEQYVSTHFGWLLLWARQPVYPKV